MGPNLGLTLAAVQGKKPGPRAARRAIEGRRRQSVLNALPRDRQAWDLPGTLPPLLWGHMGGSRSVPARCPAEGPEPSRRASTGSFADSAMVRGALARRAGLPDLAAPLGSLARAKGAGPGGRHLSRNRVKPPPTWRLSAHRGKCSRRISSGAWTP